MARLLPLRVTRRGQLTTGGRVHKYATFILPADLKSAEGSALKSNFNSFKHFQIVLPSPAVQNSAAKSLEKQYNKIGRNFFMLENQTEKYTRSI